MGVSINAMSKLRLLDPHERTDDCWDNHVVAYTYACFARSAEGLADADVGTTLPGRTPMVAQRCYEETPGTVKLRVVDMSYGGYNHWRKCLSQAVIGKAPKEVWMAEDTTLPFYDLIAFADNEGCIGPVAATRLLGDFRNESYRGAHVAAFEESDRGWATETWDKFLTGCELAADGGLIKFS